MRSRGLASEGQLLEGGHLSSAPRWGQSVALCLSHSLAAPPGKRRAQGRGAGSRMPTSWRPGHTGALAQGREHPGSHADMGTSTDLFLPGWDCLTTQMEPSGWKEDRQGCAAVKVTVMEEPGTTPETSTCPTPRVTLHPVPDASSVRRV